MSTLVSFPGRYGDLLWSLPTARAISEQRGEPVDLAIAGEFASIVPLLQEQPYLNEVIVLPGWDMTPPNWKAPLHDDLLQEYCWDEILDLGYKEWPTCPLPYYIAQQAKQQIDLKRPWITVPPWADFADTVVVGFTEAWFELKLGLLHSLLHPEHRVLPMDGTNRTFLHTVEGSRWQTEGWAVPTVAFDWLLTARVLQDARLFFGDCSALHVLACATGTPVLLCEPMEARWNPIFYPYGMDGPEVTVVMGNDDKPTFDARACADALRERLQTHVDGVR